MLVSVNNIRNFCGAYLLSADAVNRKLEAKGSLSVYQAVLMASVP